MQLFDPELIRTSLAILSSMPRYVLFFLAAVVLLTILLILSILCYRLLKNKKRVNHKQNLLTKHRDNQNSLHCDKSISNSMDKTMKNQSRQPQDKRNSTHKYFQSPNSQSKQGTIPAVLPSITHHILLRPDIFSILFTSVGTEHLPVNTVIQTAVMLAQENRSVLIIDMDFDRNAVQRVFMTHSEDNFKIASGICTTFFDNIHIWPANHFKFANTIDTSKDKGLQNNYDLILINCPNYRLFADSGALKADLAYIFADKKEIFDSISPLLQDSSCPTTVMCDTSGSYSSYIEA